MKWNPFTNAVGAAAYVWGIGLLMRYISTVRQATPDKFIDPIGALSVAVFSAAVMGFLFFYRPVALLIEDKKSEALSFFLKTLAIFGAITAATVLGILLMK